MLLILHTRGISHRQMVKKLATHVLRVILRIQKGRPASNAHRVIILLGPGRPAWSVLSTLSLPLMAAHVSLSIIYLRLMTRMCQHTIPRSSQLDKLIHHCCTIWVSLLRIWILRCMRILIIITSRCADSNQVCVNMAFSDLFSLIHPRSIIKAIPTVFIYHQSISAISQASVTMNTRSATKKTWISRRNHF